MTKLFANIFCLRLKDRGASDQLHVTILFDFTRKHARSLSFEQVFSMFQKIMDMHAFIFLITSFVLSVEHSFIQVFQVVGKRFFIG